MFVGNRIVQHGSNFLNSKPISSLGGRTGFQLHYVPTFSNKIFPRKILWRCDPYEHFLFLNLFVKTSVSLFFLPDLLCNGGLSGLEARIVETYIKFELWDIKFMSLTKQNKILWHLSTGHFALNNLGQTWQRACSWVNRGSSTGLAIRLTEGRYCSFSSTQVLFSAIFWSDNK